MDDNGDVYKSFVLFDYFEPRLCAEIKSYLDATKDLEQFEIAFKTLRDSLVYLANQRQRVLTEQSRETTAQCACSHSITITGCRKAVSCQAVDAGHSERGRVDMDKPNRLTITSVTGAERIAELEAQLREANEIIDANRWPDTAVKLLREAEHERIEAIKRAGDYAEQVNQVIDKLREAEAERSALFFAKAEAERLLELAADACHTVDAETAGYALVVDKVHAIGAALETVRAERDSALQRAEEAEARAEAAVEGGEGEAKHG